MAWSPVTGSESLFQAVHRLRFSWHFGRLRPVKCWLRFGHAWDFHEYRDKHGDTVREDFCARCHEERYSFRLRLLWGTPLVWRVSFRLKHGHWPEPRRV